jgi:hypothetical protein
VGSCKRSKERSGCLKREFVLPAERVLFLKDTALSDWLLVFKLSFIQT